MTVISVPYVTRTAYAGLSTDTKPIDARSWSLFIEMDTGFRFRFFDGSWVQDPLNPTVTEGRFAVTDMVPIGDIRMGEVINQQESPVTRIASSTPMFRFYISFTRIQGNSTADQLYIVLNATDDADADAKLGTVGERHVVPIGTTDSVDFPLSMAIKRVDIASDAPSENGNTKLFWRYIAVLPE